MFKKNDESLISAYKIYKALIIALGVIYSIVGIVLLATAKTGTGYYSYTNPVNIILGLVFLIGSPLIAWAMWVITKASFGLLFDVKFIRNKLYDSKNDYLLTLGEYQANYSATGYSQNNSALQPSIADSPKLSVLISTLNTVKSVLYAQTNSKPFSNEYFKNGYIQGVNDIILTFEPELLRTQDLSHSMLNVIKNDDFDPSFCAEYVNGVREGRKVAVKLTLFYIESYEIKYPLSAISELKALVE